MSSSVLSPRRTDATGSGGKILRGRRTASRPVSPYLRPNPPPSRPQNSTWFSGLFSGAGKLLSSVFRPSPSPPLSESASSKDDDDDDDDDDNDDRDNDDDILSKAVEELDQANNGMAPVSNEDCAIVTQPAAQKSEAKLAIEQLLRQETFSRDECLELTKLIQSRVVDSPTTGGEDATGKGLHDRNLRSDVASPEAPVAWRSLSQTRKTSEAFPYSAGLLAALSPSASALQAHSPDVRDTAIMEARKWLEEKKMEQSSNSERDHGPCALNTAMLPCVSEGEVSSPVDVARSFMRAQPPCASPSLSNARFNTPPPIGPQLSKDESPYTIVTRSLTSSNVLKRNSLAIGSWDITEESRRVRLKPTDDMLEPPAVRQIDSSTTISEHKMVQSPAAADKREVVGITNDSNSLPPAKSVDASADLPAESSVGRDGILHSSAEKSVEVNPSVTDGVDNMTENQVLVINISGSEPKVMTSEEANPSDAGGVADYNDAHASVQEIGSQVGKTVQDKSHSEPHQLSGLKETSSTHDSRLPGAEIQMQKEANGSEGGNDANGSFKSSSSAEMKGDLGMKPSVKIDQNSIGLSHAVLATGKLAETWELSSEVSMEFPVTTETNNIADGVDNGTTGNKQEEALPTKHRPGPRSNSSRGRSGKLTTVKPDGLLQSESQPSRSRSRAGKPSKSEADEPPKAETRTNPSRGLKRKSSAGAMKLGTRAGSARRGRARGK
ncbi:protein KAKU4-like isoform X2 [Magnolia sinica]|uniref:protein KAKU4-like isoform X2 n=1 Tax=Magnolia sinica TaxID=86752 RepID=UPI00265A1844|nr:protein KAKU4-like isoform X2 [Magnolia sinica]